MATNPQQDIGEDVKGVLSLQGDDLDFAIAEKVLGAQWHDVPAAGGTALRFTPAGNSIATSWTGRGPLMPHYSTSLDAIRPVVERARYDLGDDAVAEAIQTVVEEMTGSGHRLASMLADATALSRAILLAYAEKEARNAD